MIIILTAAGCLLASAALWKGAFSFTVDAAPIGSMMMATSVLLFAVSLFLFGVGVGTMHTFQ